MSDEGKDPELSQHDIDELLRPPGGPDDSHVQDVPCTIYSESGTFRVKDVGGWYYHQIGVFASGRWDHEELPPRPAPERDVLIPYDKILHMEFDFERLRRYEEEGATTVDEPESNSD